MKSLHKLLAASLLLAGTLGTASAQVKIGTNPTTITATTNLEVEATNGSKVLVNQTNSVTQIGFLDNSYNFGHQLNIKGHSSTKRWGLAPNLVQTRYNGTEAAPTAVLSGEQVGALTFEGFAGGGPSGPRPSMANLFVYAAENVTASAAGAHMTFRTAPIGTVIPLERMRITESGNVGIGTTTPAWKLQVVDNADAPLVANVWNQNTAGAAARQMVILGTGAKSAFLSYNNENFNLGPGNEAISANTLTIGVNAQATGGFNLATGGNSPIRFFVATPGGGWSAAFERMRIHTNGFVGIGTTTPTNNLHVLSAANPLRLEGLQAGAAADEVLTTDATGVVRKLSTASVAAANEPWFGTDDNMGATSNTEDVYQMGKVGIGTTTPNGALHIYKDANFRIDRARADGFAPGMIMRKARGSVGSETATISGDFLGLVVMAGHDGTQFSDLGGAYMGSVSEENFTTTAKGARFEIGTTPIGSNTRTRRMIIDNAGNMLIGNTTTPSVKLDVNGYIKVGSSDTTGDAAPVNGMLRYNSGTGKFQGYTGGAWVDLH